MVKEDPIMCVQISGSEKDIRAFIAKRSLNLEGAQREGDRVVGYAFVRQSIAKDLKGTRVEVRVLYNATELGKERQKEVMRDNPFADGSIPKGLGKKVKADGHVS